MSGVELLQLSLIDLCLPLVESYCFKVRGEKVLCIVVIKIGHQFFCNSVI